MSKILFITGKAERCGVADYGKRLFAILKQHMDIDFLEVEKDQDINYTGYNTAIYNYHYATLPYASVYKYFPTAKGVKHIALFHEAHLMFSPDVVINVSDLPRPLFEDFEIFDLPKYAVPVIGSFGFGFPDKNFPGLCRMVKDQFEKAAIRLNIPFAQYGDDQGILAKLEAEKCKAILAGSEVSLIVNHDFLNQKSLLHFLSLNDINIFNYNQSHGRGLSSTIDYALSVRKPIGVSNSEMFRHLPKEICLEGNTIPELIKAGIEPLRKVYEDNSNAKLVEKIKSICG